MFETNKRAPRIIHNTDVKLCAPHANHERGQKYIVAVRLAYELLMGSVISILDL